MDTRPNKLTKAGACAAIGSMMGQLFGVAFKRTG
jgi:hypothetical protein